MYEMLKKLCLEKNISVSKLCEITTGSKGNLGTWKKGSFNAETLVKIADYFDVSVDYILGRTEHPHVATSCNIVNVETQSVQNFGQATEELISSYNRLSLCGKAKIMTMVAEIEKEEANG